MEEQSPKNKWEIIADSAETLAENYQLPENWQEYRPICRGIALDGSYTSDRDDAFAIYSTPQGETKIDVHISDLGSFLYDQDAFKRYAAVRVATEYRGITAVRPMLPRPISEDKFSLTDAAERPVLTVSTPLSGNYTSQPEVSRGRLQAQLMTPEQFKDAYQSGDLMAIQLMQTARDLFRQRTGQSADDAYVESEDGDFEDEVENDPAAFVVEELMVQANAALARFRQQHSIPGFYRKYTAGEMIGAVEEPGFAVRSLYRALYTASPDRHDGVNLPVYGHHTSPLRRFPDFVSDANIAAFLDGRPFPFTSRYINWSIERTNAVLLYRRRSSFSYRRPAAKPAGDSQSRGSQADSLAQNLADGTLRSGSMATILTNQITGPVERIASLRSEVAGHISRNIGISYEILRTMLIRGWIGESDKTAVETALNIKNSTKRSIITTETLGRLAGIDIEFERPREETPEERAMRKPFRTLNALARQHGLQVRPGRGKPDESGEFNFTLTVLGTKQPLKITIRCNSWNKAKDEAARQLIEEYGLLGEKPEILQREAPAAKGDRNGQRHSPLTNLAVRAQRAYVPLPEYTIQTDEDGLFSCTARLTDYDGQTYECTGIGTSKRTAKEAAATNLLTSLPAEPTELERKFLKDFFTPHQALTAL